MMSRLRPWTLASATVLLLAAVAPGRAADAPGGPRPGPTAVATASVRPTLPPPPPEGLVRIRRGTKSLDLESLINPSQPDFFLSIEIPDDSVEATMATPTPAPTLAPTPVPTIRPRPTPEPTVAPSVVPSAGPSLEPSVAPSAEPSPEPSLAPTPRPSLAPTPRPTVPPTRVSFEPTPEPSPAGDVAGTLKRVAEAQRLANRGQYRSALELVEGAIASEPGVASLHAMRGSLLVKLKDYSEAQVAWETALELDPGATDVKASLAWLRRRGGRD